MVRFPKKSSFDIHDPKGIKRLFQLRVGLSPLQHHKMRKVFMDTPTDICRCLRSPETTEHYLIHCDLYTEPRLNMFHVINPILESHGLQLHGDLLINLLLYGNNNVQEATKSIMMNEFAPSFGMGLRQVLTKALDVAITPALSSNDNEAAQRYKNFEELMKRNWFRDIGRAAAAVLRNKRFNRPKVMPLTKDLQILCRHIRGVMSKNEETLTNNNSDINAWRELENSCLASLILFNRRRSGEASRILITSLTNRHSNAVDEEVLCSLTALEKQLTKILTRIETQGKRGRTVPVILTPAHVRCMELLVKCREEMGVPRSNVYLFAVASSDNHIRGYDAIKRYVKEVDLEIPDVITGTNLRKHIATLSQVLNLEQNELDMMAGFLGHDINIHREYYRLPEHTLQLAKCTKILLAMDSGISAYAGKKLSEIDVDISNDGKKLYIYWRSVS